MSFLSLAVFEDETPGICESPLVVPPPLVVVSLTFFSELDSSRLQGALAAKPRGADRETDVGFGLMHVGL